MLELIFVLFLKAVGITFFMIVALVAMIRYDTIRRERAARKEPKQ